MTAFEIISIFIGILALLMSFGSLIVALPAFLDKRNNKPLISCRLFPTEDRLHPL